MITKKEMLLSVLFVLIIGLFYHTVGLSQYFETSSNHQYTFQQVNKIESIDRVIDGDTFVCDINIGFGISQVVGMWCLWNKGIK